MTFDLGTIHGAIDFDTTPFDKKYERVEQLLDNLEKRQVPEVKVDADTATAEKNLNAVESFLTGVLDGMRAEVEVSGDTDRATKAIQVVEDILEDMHGEQARIEVLADTDQAEDALDDIADKADESGDDAGSRMGEGMVAGILAGLASIPIAGAVVKVGQAIGGGLIEGIQDGLNVEVSRDLFSARTGLDEQTAARFGRAAGNAYANVFGESVEANLDAARTAMQSGILDADASTGEIEKIIAGLDTVATILDEDIPNVARTAGVMLRNGLAQDAGDAFDQLVAAGQNGINVSEDLLDTFTEYPALFARLGLDGPMAMGLISQAVQAGARDTDFAADALKEFQIRATDASDASAEAFEALGLDAEEMTAKIAEGGEGAAEGLQQVLEGLRDMEDPVERNQVAVGLFGTKAEDLGEALFAMDTSTAVKQLGDFEGAAKTAMETLGDNPAAAVESAQRNIEVAADGIKGALASAFGEPLEDLSDWVTNNRAGVMEFLGGMTNMAFDAGRAVVEFSASGLEAMGDFIEFGIVQTILALDGLITQLDALGIIDVDSESIDAMVEGLRDARWGAYEAADGMRTALIDEGIDPIQDRFNEFLSDEVLTARVQDTTNIMAEAIDGVGASLEDLNDIEVFEDGSFKKETDDAKLFDEQLRTAAESMYAAQEAAIAAGGSQEDLNRKWGIAYSTLVSQVEQLGYTREEAMLLIEQYGLFPDFIDTKVRLATSDAEAQMAYFLSTIPSTVTVRAVAVGSAAGLALGMGPGHADGGAVVGAGGPRDDLIPAIGPDGEFRRLSNGEHVLDADDVLDLGGQAGAYQLRAMIQAGMVKPLQAAIPMADGGGIGHPAAVGGGTTIGTLEQHFHNTPADPRELMRVSMWEVHDA